MNKKLVEGEAAIALTMRCYVTKRTRLNLVADIMNTALLWSGTAGLPGNAFLIPNTISVFVCRCSKSLQPITEKIQ
jgi:hypothetical protein